MKKLLNISVIAALAILPMAANADITTTDPGATNADAPVAANAPKYSLATAHETDANLATAGYVKGAYNATIKAINKVATTANSAVQSVTAGATNGTITVDGNSVTAYDDSALSGRVDTAETDIDNLETNVGTLTNLATTEKGSLVGAINELKTASGNYITKDVNDLTNYTTTTAMNTLLDAKADATDLDTLEGRVDTAETDIDNLETDVGTLTNLATTEKGSLVGAINELKTASGDYATKAGVLATINNSTVPVMAQWGSTTATTVSVDAPASFVNQ